MMSVEQTVADFIRFTEGKNYHTIYADPPWRFANRTGKMAPEHKRLRRYDTMDVAEIKALPVAAVAAEKARSAAGTELWHISEVTIVPLRTIQTAMLPTSGEAIRSASRATLVPVSTSLTIAQPSELCMAKESRGGCTLWLHVGRFDTPTLAIWA